MNKLVFICLLVGITFSLKSQSLRIAGNIQTANNEVLCNTIVILNNENGESIAATTTDLEGNYTFENLTSNQTYEVSVKREGNSMDGVSILDVLLLREHLVGTYRINDPFVLVTSDVNNSGSLTTFDLIVIRKFILGIEENSSVGSWKFFSTDAQINNAADLPIDSRIYENLMTSVMDADFIGYKFGDVNNSIVTDCN